MFSEAQKNEIFEFIGKTFHGENLDCLKYSPLELYSGCDTEYLSGSWCEGEEWIPFSRLKERIGADRVESGASKIVFIWDNLDFVIKIPYRGNGYYTENCEEPELKGVVDFERSSCLAEPWNYCEVEAQIYKDAYKKDLDYFFCGTEYIGCIGDIEFYASEKMDKCFQYDVKPSDESYRKAHFSPYNVDMNDNCAAILFEQNDEDEVYKLQEFLLSWGINDFHCGNFGYVGDYLRIIDYSGFFE